MPLVCRLRPPRDLGFLSMILFELFEVGYGNMMVLDMENTVEHNELPNDLMQDNNPPKNAKRFIESVEMIQWCGVNEPVHYTVLDEKGPDDYERISNELQAEYLVTVTDEKYLSTKAKPSLISGNMHMQSTAYDSGSKVIVQGPHVETTIHPRCDFVCQASEIRKQYIKVLGDDDNKLSIDGLQTILKFFSSVTDETDIDSIREQYHLIMYGAITDDRSICALSALDRVAMRSLGSNKAVDLIAHRFKEEAYDVLESPEGDKWKAEQTVNLRKILLETKDSIQPLLGVLTKYTSRNLQWIDTFVTDSAEKDGQAVVQALKDVVLSF